MPSVIYALIMVTAGFCIPIFASMTGRMGVAFSHPPMAALLAIGIGLCFLIPVVVLYGKPQTLGGVPSYTYFGGILFFYYLLCISFIGPKFGLANAIFCVLVGQMISSLMIDQFGLFGMKQVPIDKMRICGVFLMVAGLILVIKR